MFQWAPPRASSNPKIAPTMVLTYGLHVIVHPAPDELEILLIR